MVAHILNKAPDNVKILCALYHEWVISVLALQACVTGEPRSPFPIYRLSAMPAEKSGVFDKAGENAQ